MSYATVDDLNSRLSEDNKLTKTERARAKVLLDDVAVHIDNALAKAHKEVDRTDINQAKKLKVVSCSVVSRILKGTSLLGVSTSTVTAGDFSESRTIANPHGDIYFTKNEKDLLGITVGARIGTDHNAKVQET